jgi:hypothetical protein
MMNDLIPVEGRDGWFRDPDSNAIINANQSDYDKYMATYNKRQTELSEKKALQNDVSELKSEISEIKSLLKTLANKTVS